MSPALYHSLHYVPPREKECLWLIYIHLLLANLTCYSVNQLIPSLLTTLFIGSYYQNPHSANQKRCYVTASCYRSLNALTEVEEPAEIGNRSGQAPIATDPFCLQG